MTETSGFTVFPDGAVLLLPCLIIHVCIVSDFYFFLYSFRSFLQQFISIFHSAWKMESSCWCGINLKHAWFFVFDSLEYPFDLRYLRHINSIIETNLIRNAGVVGNISVPISGTDWIPSRMWRCFSVVCVSGVHSEVFSTHVEMFLLCPCCHLKAMVPVHWLL